MLTEVRGRKVEIRRARSEDRSAVAAISAQIWDGYDYVPNVFDKWVMDSEGEFAVVCVDNEVAGFGKMTMLNGKDAWLEGLRMGENYRGLGLAKLLTRYCLDKCQERGFGSLRLSTFIENHESLHIIETHGFKRTASFKFLTADSSKAVTATGAVEVLRSLSEVNQVLDRDALARRNYFLSFDFTFERISETLLAELLSANSVLGVRHNDELTGMMILSSRHSKGNELSISYLQGQTRTDLEELVSYALASSAEVQQNLIVMCPPDEMLLSVYLEKGLRKELDSDEMDVFVYEHESTLSRV